MREQLVTCCAVAVDGSDSSMQAVAWACRVTAPGGTVVMIDIQDFTALYNEMGMVPFGGGPTVDVEGISTQWDAYARAVSRLAMDTVTSQGRHGVWLLNIMQPGEGSPAEVFAKMAQDHGAEILLVGQHHGSTRIEGLFGSFPRYLVSHGHLPVLIVPVPANLHSEPVDPIGRSEKLSPS